MSLASPLSWIFSCSCILLRYSISFSEPACFSSSLNLSSSLAFSFYSTFACALNFSSSWQVVSNLSLIYLASWVIRRRLFYLPASSYSIFLAASSFIDFNFNLKASLVSDSSYSTLCFSLLASLILSFSVISHSSLAMRMFSNSLWWRPNLLEYASFCPSADYSSVYRLFLSTRSCLIS